jgi:hypothetical protein
VKDATVTELLLNILADMTGVILRHLLLSVAVLVRRDEHTYDTEKWLDRALSSKTLNEERAEEIFAHAAQVKQEDAPYEALVLLDTPITGSRALSPQDVAHYLELLEKDVEGDES